MAVQTQNGITTLTPNAWLWWPGAGLVFFLLPGFGVLVAVIFLLMGAGVLQQVRLSPEHIRVRNWFSTKSYAWEAIDDFRIHKIKSGLFTAANMIAFTKAGSDATAMGKAAKFLTGGTHTIPVIGMPATKLVQLMRAYKLGFVPEETAQLELGGADPKPAIGFAPLPQEKRAKPRARSVPATPRADTLRPKTDATMGKRRAGSTPMVQEGGGLFRVRRSKSPFGS